MAKLEPLLNQARQYLTRARHRVADGIDIAAFSLCPLPSWSTHLHLPATTSDSNQTYKGSTAIDLEINQWTSLGSGGFVWSGARRLAKKLQQNGDGQIARPAITMASNKNDGNTSNSKGWIPVMEQTEHLAVASRSWAGLNVIELGAGTGILGLAVAAMGANVTLTDQAAFVYPGDEIDEKVSTAALEQGRSLLDLLKSNAKLNLSLTQAPGQQDVQVHEMRWGSASHHAALPQATFDVVVASDVLLFIGAQQELLNTLKALSTPTTVILIEHTDRSGGPGDAYPEDMLNFLRLLATDNANTRGGEAIWSPQVIHDHGRHITLRISQQTQSQDADTNKGGFDIGTRAVV